MKVVVASMTLLLLLAGIPAGDSLAAAAGGPAAPGLDPRKRIHHYVHDVWTVGDGLPSNTIRDIVQNHLAQVLSLVGMEVPVAWEADAVRNEKIKVLRALRPIDLD